MTKKKWREQASDYFRRILDSLNFLECGAHIDQYKSLLFNIFADAYRSGFCYPSYRFDEKRGRVVKCKSQRPLVCGETIWNYAKQEGWVHGEMMANEKRYQDIQRVMTWFEEWAYAWDRPRPRRKYTRKRPG